MLLQRANFWGWLPHFQARPGLLSLKFELRDSENVVAESCKSRQLTQGHYFVFLSMDNTTIHKQVDARAISDNYDLNDPLWSHETNDITKYYIR